MREDPLFRKFYTPPCATLSKCVKRVFAEILGDDKLPSNKNKNCTRKISPLLYAYSRQYTGGGRREGKKRRTSRVRQIYAVKSLIITNDPRLVENITKTVSLYAQYGRIMLFCISFIYLCTIYTYIGRLYARIILVSRVKMYTSSAIFLQQLFHYSSPPSHQTKLHDILLYTRSLFYSNRMYATLANFLKKKKVDRVTFTPSTIFTRRFIKAAQRKAEKRTRVRYAWKFTYVVNFFRQTDVTFGLHRVTQ